MTKRRNSGLSRRELIQHIATAAALGTLGTMAAVNKQALAATGDRKFLFFFATGGWDPTPLDPKFGPDGVSPVAGTDMDPMTSLGSIGNLSWSSGPDRQSMDRFFARWGNRVCMVRGVNVHSAGHASGMHWMMTGTSASAVADWPTILAANGTVEYPMPHLVFSGPSYPGSFGAAVVRGGGGTLLSLIDGTYAGTTDVPAPVVPSPMDSMMDAYVYKQASKYAAAQTVGLGYDRADALVGNLDRSFELEGRRFEAGLDKQGRTMLDQAMMAAEVMRLGLTRCAIVNIPGYWDTHGGNQGVGAQLDSFFTDFDSLLTHLSTTPGNVASWLIDEVTIVCMSELGRTPKFNGARGRDHWPYASCLVAAGGIAGNKVLGKTDDAFIAENVNFQTGQPDPSGAIIGTENLGAALLQLGGLDSEHFRPGVQPLTGILREG